MSRKRSRWLLAIGVVACCRLAAAGEVVFEDDFEGGLSGAWEAVGLDDNDYRVRDGVLEMRARPGQVSASSPRLQVRLPDVGDDFVVTAEVAPADRFTTEGERAGVYLTDDHGLDFSGRIQLVDRSLVYAPPAYRFNGDDINQQGDPVYYDKTYTQVRPELGPLRIQVSQGYAFFSVGSSGAGKMRQMFHSAISTSKERGIALVASGATEGDEHWVRFDNVRVEKH